jgi:hypothetical protein
MRHSDTLIGENLRCLAGMHLTARKQVAQAWQISESAVGHIYAGRTSPSPGTMVLAAVSYGVSPEDLNRDTGTCIRAAAAAFERAPIRHVSSSTRDLIHALVGELYSRPITQIYDLVCHTPPGPANRVWTGAWPFPMPWLHILMKTEDTRLVSTFDVAAAGGVILPVPRPDNPIT